MKMFYIFIPALKSHYNFNPIQCVFFLLIFFFFSSSAYSEKPNTNDLFDIPFDELRDLQIAGSGTLTEVNRRESPALIIHIDRRMIESSGARRLEELLFIYVPSMSWIRHPSLPARIELRGVVSDINDKVLLLVNGRIMNNRLLLGVQSELGVPMLDDIKAIDVISGPSSATYGAGAISGIINIHTQTGYDMQGLDLTVKVGVVEEFESLEISLGKQFNDESNIYFHYGVDHARGADPDDAPLYSSHAFTFDNGTVRRVSNPPSPIAVDIPNDQAAYFNKPRHNFHLEYIKGSWESWLRHTTFSTARDASSDRTYNKNPNARVRHQLRDKQTTLFSQYNYEMKDSLDIDFSISWDRYDAIRELASSYDVMEEEFIIRSIANWQWADHQVSGGFEYIQEEFDSARQSDDPNSKWNSTSKAALIEHQWQVSEQLTSFLSGRIDKQESTENTFSPRLALVYLPTEKATLKTSVARSHRRSSDFALHNLEQGGNKGDVEEILTFDIQFDYQYTPNFLSKLSYYNSTLDLVAHDFSAQDSLPLGEVSFHGIEFSSTYRTDAIYFMFSHTYTDLRDFKPIDASRRFVFTAEHLGYGSDFANISPHMTKLAAHWQLNELWLINLSLQYLWGFPGAEDWANYNRDVLLASLPEDQQFVGLAFTNSDGSNRAFGHSAFLNLGTRYQVTSQLNFSLNLHNALGFLDKKHNKRNIQDRMGMYRSEAAALTFAINYQF